jgi:hypothetical protein
MKLLDACISEALWIPEVNTIYPIPYAVLSTGSIALPFAIGSLYYMTPNRNCKNVHEKWQLCINSLFLIASSIATAALWAVGILQLHGTVWQKMLAFSFGFFQWFFKSVLATHAVKLDPYRFIPMQLVVDATIFVPFQVSTFPFMDGLALVFLILGKSSPYSGGFTAGATVLAFFVALAESKF